MMLSACCISPVGTPGAFGSPDRTPKMQQSRGSPLHWKSQEAWLPEGNGATLRYVASFVIKRSKYSSILLRVNEMSLQNIIDSLHISSILLHLILILLHIVYALPRCTRSTQRVDSSLLHRLEGTSLLPLNWRLCSFMSLQNDLMLLHFS
jgi:hypothetical protein